MFIGGAFYFFSMLPTIEEVLKKSDREILDDRSGILMVVVARAYRDITKSQTMPCKMQYKDYLRTVRLKYSQQAQDYFYFEGVTYKGADVSDSLKAKIKQSNPILFNNLSKKFNWL